MLVGGFGDGGKGQNTYDFLTARAGAAEKYFCDFGFIDWAARWEVFY